MLFRSNVESAQVLWTLLNKSYGEKIASVKSTLSEKRLLKIFYPNRISNERLYERLRQGDVVVGRKWRWTGCKEGPRLFDETVISIRRQR